MVEENEHVTGRGFAVPIEQVLGSDGQPKTLFMLAATDEEAMSGMKRAMEQELGGKFLDEPVERGSRRSFGLGDLNWSNCKWQPAGSKNPHLN